MYGIHSRGGNGAVDTSTRRIDDDGNEEDEPPSNAIASAGTPDGEADGFEADGMDTPASPLAGAVGVAANSSAERLTASV